MVHVSKVIEVHIHIQHIVYMQHATIVGYH